MSINAPIRRGRGLAALIATLAVLTLLVAANLLVSYHRLPRIDLTAEKLYTLSDSTRRTMAGLSEPIDLRLFVSDRLAREVPSYGQYAQRVRDLLSEYVGLSGGALRLTVLNPEPFSDVEDRAVAYGLQGVPIDAGGETVYFGLVGTNQADDEETVPFFQPERERFLEYDLTKLVATLANPKKKVVGLITSLPIDGDPMLAMRGQGGEPWVVLEQMRQFFEVRSLDSTAKKIPDEIDVLMLVHPQLPDTLAYAVDQFVMRGGRLLAFIDPHSEGADGRSRQAMMRGGAPIPPSSTLDPLLGAWGVEFAKDQVIGDRRLARRVQLPSGGSRNQAADYIAWLAIPKDRLNAQSPVTGQLSSINVASAGMLGPVAGASTQVDPLISSSASSMKLPVDKVRGQPDVLKLLRDFQPDNQPKTIAARITGPVKSAFPDGPPAAAKEGEGAVDPATHIADAKKPLNAVLVADTDLLEDRYWVQTQNFFGQRVATPSAGNADFVVNVIDDLLGADTLIGLRSRGVSERPFTYIQAVQAQAENRFRAKEQELTEKLKDAERKLSELRRGGEGGQAILNAEQAKTLDALRAQIVATRGELRAVQRDLRQDMERLRAVIHAVTIGAVPVLVILFAMLLGLVNRGRRARAARTVRA